MKLELINMLNVLFFILDIVFILSFIKKYVF